MSTLLGLLILFGLPYLFCAAIEFKRTQMTWLYIRLRFSRFGCRLGWPFAI